MIRTDLALEAKEMYEKENVDKIEGIDAFEKEEDGVFITYVEIKNPKGAEKLGKAEGKYVTMQMPSFERIGNGYYKACVNILTRELKRLCNMKEKPVILVAGLGNRKITPDALGPLCVEGLIVTHHLKEMNISALSSFGDVSAMSTGVLGITGIESAEVIKGLCKKINPDMVICIDSLASRKADRLATTIQITDTGISPGSGIGNSRSEISEKTVGSKVIAVGVPFVMDVATIVYDSLYDEFNQTEYDKIKEKTKEMIVTPKDIDNLVSVMSKIISSAINSAFHNIDPDELYLYT